MKMIARHYIITTVLFTKLILVQAVFTQHIELETGYITFTGGLLRPYVISRDKVNSLVPDMVEVRGYINKDYGLILRTGYRLPHVLFTPKITSTIGFIKRFEERSISEISLGFTTYNIHPKVVNGVLESKTKWLTLPLPFTAAIRPEVRAGIRLLSRNNPDEVTYVEDYVELPIVMSFGRQHKLWITTGSILFMAVRQSTGHREYSLLPFIPPLRIGISF